MANTAAPSAVEAVRPAPSVSIAEPRVAEAKAPVTITPAAQAVSPKAPAAAVPAPPLVAAQPPAVLLDLGSLETRLRQTKAIGVFTKLALKNQVDDLLTGFRAYHKQQAAARLAELRRSFDMLMLKALALLQDGDPPLARDIVKSRAAIWSILADRKKFIESNLMAGATP